MLYNYKKEEESCSPIPIYKPIFCACYRTQQRRSGESLLSPILFYKSLHKGFQNVKKEHRKTAPQTIYGAVLF